MTAARLAPVDGAAADDEVTAAAADAPHGRVERDGPVPVRDDLPLRTRLGQQVEMNGFAAAAGTRQRRGPGTALLTDQVDRPGAQGVRDLVARDGPVGVPGWPIEQAP